jgi:hypothetical protein
VTNTGEVKETQSISDGKAINTYIIIFAVKYFSKALSRKDDEAVG